MDWSQEKENLREEISLILVRTGALKFGTFTLSTGHLSPYYVDLRLIPSFPDLFNRISFMYTRLAQEDIGIDSFDRIAGIPISAIPYAAALTVNLKKPLLLVRKEPTDGRHKQIEGLLKPGDRILPIDDVITTGGNLTSTVKVLRHEGAIVEKALVLVDREEHGVEKLQQEGVKVVCLVTITQAAKILYDLEVISKEEYKAIRLQTKKNED
jgi:orotate phosphoribosyltransferase